MNRSIFQRCVPAMFLAALTGCATPEVGNSGRPMAFHDTRLQYAILTDDKPVLQKEFAMSPDRTVTERIVAAVVLPFAAATDTVFWPLHYAFASCVDDCVVP